MDIYDCRLQKNIYYVEMSGQDVVKLCKLSLKCMPSESEIMSESESQGTCMLGMFLEQAK